MVLFDQKAREKLQQGIDLLANAVKSTLGPRGRNVVIEKPFSEPHVTKDGVTVARAIKSEDPVENMGIMLVKQAASTTADLAGDGTTTSTVLAQAMIEEGLYSVEKLEKNPIDIKRGMDLALKDALKLIDEQSEEISLESDRIEQVATISANNDVELGTIIGSAIKRVGRDGVVLVEESKNSETEIDYIQGVTFDKGYMSDQFVTDDRKMVVEYDEPLILFVDENIRSIQSLLPFIEACNYSGEQQFPLVIVANDIIDQAVNMLVANKMSRGLQVVTIKAPSFGDHRDDLMQDMAIATGATYISGKTGKNLQQFRSPKSLQERGAILSFLGQCEKVTVNKNSTTFLGNVGDEEQINIRINQIKSQLGSEQSAGYKYQMKERIAKLSDGIAVIKVGAATEIEMREKKDRVDDAVAATQAALEAGIVPGGGLTLARCFAKLKRGDNLGYNLVVDSLIKPMLVIMANAGASDDDTTRAATIIHNDTGRGYDALNDQWVVLKDEGIIDPTKVTKIALENAVSVASTVIMTNVTINMNPKDKPQEI